MTSNLQINDIVRPPREWCDALARIGSATAASELSLMGIRDAQIRGPMALKPGKSVAGPALTLQMMPKREDQYGANEYDNPELQLHRHVLYPSQAGDMVVVDARGDMGSGIFGEMMLTFFAGRGGLGVVIDGCIRDAAKAKELDLGIWVRGATPNYHAQTNLMPYAVNVPIACNNAFVMPGDIIIGDDDGVVVVPVSMAEALIERASEHAEWEEFSRYRLSQGGDLKKYYPLTAEVQDEYLAWKAAQA
jgi:regulator of RNase E activity RraA